MLGLVAAGLAARGGGPRRTFGFHRGEVLAALINGLALVALGRASSWSRRSAASPTRRRSRAAACSSSECWGWRVTPGRRSCSLVASAATSTSRPCCATRPPTRWARSAVIVSGLGGPRLRLARGRPDREPRDRRPDHRLVGAARPRAARRPDGERAVRGSTSTSWATALCAVEGVRSVHELHVWTVTSGFEALAAHVVTATQGPTATASAASWSSCCATVTGSSTRRSRWRRRARRARCCKLSCKSCNDC